jgi:hypothetical protein
MRREYEIECEDDCKGEWESECEVECDVKPKEARSSADLWNLAESTCRRRSPPLDVTNQMPGWKQYNVDRMEHDLPAPK